MVTMTSERIIEQENERVGDKEQHGDTDYYVCLVRSVFPSMICKRRIELHATLLLLLLLSVLLCFFFSAQEEVRFPLVEFSVAREWMEIA